MLADLTIQLTVKLAIIAITLAILWGIGYVLLKWIGAPRRHGVSFRRT